MKKWMIGLALLLAIGGTMAFVPLDSVHVGYRVLRAEADEDTDLLDLTTEGNFGNKPASAVQLNAKDDGTGHGGNAIEVIFAGGSAADENFTYKLYAWRRSNGPGRLIVTGVVTLGTQAVVIYPGPIGQSNAATAKFWGDTATITTKWIKLAWSSDETGANGIASVHCDLAGFEWVWCEITDADGTTGTEAGDVSVYYAYW